MVAANLQALTRSVKSDGRVLGFDMDGTMVDHSANKIRLAREYGYDLTAPQTPSGVLGRFLPSAVKDELQTRLYTDLETTLKSPLMPGAAEGLAAVKASGVPYYLLSYRQPEIGEALLRQLGLWPEIFKASNTAFVESTADKVPQAEQWGITHYVDDHLSTLEQGLRFIPNRWLFDPYAVLPASHDYAKVTNWDDLIKQILA